MRFGLLTKAAACTCNCGHGGAYATNMSLDPQRRLITVYMVQHAGYPGPDGGKIHGAFVNAANEAFGK